MAEGDKVEKIGMINKKGNSNQVIIGESSNKVDMAKLTRTTKATIARMAKTSIKAITTTMAITATAATAAISKNNCIKRCPVIITCASNC